MTSLKVLLDKLIDTFILCGNSIFFFNVFFKLKYFFPFLIFFLILISFYILFSLKFYPIILIKSSIKEYFKPSKKNELSSKNLLLTTIGSSLDLGTIFAISAVISIAGPGVLFWIIFGGFLAIPIKFLEVYVTLKTRKINNFNGPLMYINTIFGMIKYKKIGKLMTLFFSISLATSTFATLQINQTVEIFNTIIFNQSLENSKLYISIAVAIFIFFILRNGIKGVAKFNSIIMPFAIFLYTICSFAIFIKFKANILPAISIILKDAFSFKAINGMIFYSVFTGIQRSFFCTEAGLGTAGLIHSNSENKIEIKEAVIAILNPIICSFFVTFVSGLMILITKQAIISSQKPILTIINVFATILTQDFAKYFIILLVPIFAITTACTWAYNGAYCFKYTFGEKSAPIYYCILFIGYIFSGTSDNFLKLINIGDILTLASSIPNLISITIFLTIFRKKIIKKIQFYIKQQ